MPRELSGAEEAAWNRYNGLGTPDEITSQIAKLRRESAKYRTRVGELEEAATKAPAVPEGGRILTKDEVATFDAFVALKVKPTEYQAVITERDTLKGDLAKRNRETARDAAAKALGIEGKDLASFAGADDLTYEVREQENDKKEKVQVAFVKDAAGKEHPLAEYGKTTWGRAFEAVLATAGNTTMTDASRRYVTETNTQARRTGKVTDEDVRKSVDATATYVI